MFLLREFEGGGHHRTQNFADVKKIYSPEGRRFGGVVEVNNERIRHLSGVITNAALAGLGVIGYTSIQKGQWFQAGISAVVFLIAQYLANLTLGKIEEWADGET